MKNIKQIGGYTVTGKLLINALVKFVIGLLLIGTLIFLPAGDLYYQNGWLLITLFFLPILVLGTVLFFKNPSLLEKRLNAKEKAGTQKAVVAISGLLFVVGFVIAGLDHRFGWSHLPNWTIITASIVFLLSYLLYAEVLRENTYLSRTVEIQKNQTVIQTGLYGIVRHPMYAATIWLFLSIPVILGSLWSLLCFLPYLAIIVVRIRDEEKLLAAELDGYREYQKKVKYRLLPFIW